MSRQPIQWPNAYLTGLLCVGLAVLGDLVEVYGDLKPGDKIVRRVSGKGEKTRYVPLHGVAKDLIDDYLTKTGHGADDKGALFRPLRNSRGGGREKAITPDGVYKLVRH